MKASQLRDLTRRYAAGQIGRDEYVVERTRLIDGMIAGDIEIRYRDIGPPQPATTTKVPRRTRLAVGSVLLVGLLAAALLAYFFDGDNGDMAASDGSAVVSRNPGSDLLQQFMSGNQWTETSLLQLETAWAALTPFEQESARRSVWFRQLRHETARRVSEQEALLAAGQMEALLWAARLRKFGERLGLSAEAQASN